MNVNHPTTGKLTRLHMNNSTLKYYQQNAKALATRYEAADVAQMQTMLTACFAEYSTLLEIGCGSGRDAAFMLSHGYEVTAVDGSREMIESAMKHHPELADRLLEVRLPAGLNSAFTPDSYDGIFSIATLMHLPEDDIWATLTAIATMLRPNGRFFFSVSIARDDVDEFGFDKKGRRFTPLTQEHWLQLCQHCGLREVMTKTSGDGLGRKGIVWLTCIVERILS